MWRKLVAMLTCLLAMSTMTGCNLLFRQDHRITITQPADFATVSSVVTVQWTAVDFTPPRDGQFAVFVDRDPMPPGATIGYFAPNDHFNIFVQSSTSLRLDSSHLVPTAGTQSAERNHHDVTVVLLDLSGARIGETSGFTEFTVTT